MTTRFLTITKRIFHTTLLALSPLLFATTATAQNAAGDLPFEPSEAESRITKVMAKQIEQQPYNTSDANLVTAIKTGEGIAIKADKSTPYSKIQVVMDNLQTLKMNKFSLMTALKSEDE